MYSRSGQNGTGPTTHAAQLRADDTGEAFRALEGGLEEAINASLASRKDNPSQSHHLLDTAFEAAESILEKARSIRPRRT